MVEQTYNVAIGRERKGRERGGGGEVAVSPKEPGWRLQLPFSGSLVVWRTDALSGEARQIEKVMHYYEK